MKKRWVSLLLLLCMTVLCFMGLTACGDEGEPTTPQN